ncbi:pentatricopeptide repeat-containing protein At1g71210 [Ananas comosus]|uniref:Pentatricopeptide repeat-containing protein At1g71210 n=1 Tax=Ananas comosus TaxID=4615 RepID=A0A6P5H5F4_ANACO|nr:pentatricopeptide repeat-containing protein At1g71210 [Ananas comosus]XP_020114791.1 pentatricopeptide repeat-containing protein At1g71210 [Ananas comosus]
MLLRFSHRASSSSSHLLLLFRSFSSSPSPLPPLPSFSPLLPNPNPTPSSGDIAAAFRDWFRGGEVVSLLDRIYAALASSHADDDASLDAALSPLRLPLSESLVLSALRHRPRPSLIPPSSAGDGSDPLLLLRLRFFDWSGRQHPYRHSRSAYHAIFRLLSRSPRGIPVVLDWLRLFSGAGDSPALAGGGGGGGGARPFVASIGGGPSNPRFLDTLVVGYSVAGKPELALHLLGRMRFRGLDLDAFSFHVLLNALVDASLFDFADSLHSHIASRGLAGPVTSCIRLKALCRQGRFTDAELLLRRDLSPAAAAAASSRAAATLVRALCRRRRFAAAARLVDEFGSADVYAAWIGALAGAGRLDDALDFLARKRLAEDYIPEVSSYNDLLRRLLRENLRHLDKVYDLLVEMLEEGIAPDRATMNAALRFFCKAGLVDVAVHLYNARMELGVDPNNAVYNELIAALCREGDVDQACAVLETSIQQGYFPGRQTFTILANVLCREGKLSKMQELLDGALKRKVRPISAVFTKYLSALCKAGDVEEAFMLPQMIGEENAAIIYRHRSTYTSLITAFITMGRVDVLPRFILEMQDMGHTPSRSLYRSVVCSLCERDKYEEVLGLLDKQLARKELDPLTCYNYFIDGAAHAKKPSMARELYARMENAGIQPNTDTDILLLHGYLKSKRIFDALSFFNYLREKRGLSNKLYNVFISGLCEAGKPEQAVVFWKEARERGLIPSLQCYEELVLTLSSSKDYDTVVKVLDDFRETGRPVSAFLCNVLLLHTLKSQALLRAWLQSRDKEADVDSVGTSSEIQDQQSGRLLLGQLIAAFSGGIRLRGNLDKLEEEIERFFPVDIYTYNMLLRGLSMGGRMDLASSLFERLCKKGFQPNRWTFDIMVHGFCKDGQRKEAERWMQAMARNGFFPTWYTMRLYNNAV